MKGTIPIDGLEISYEKLDRADKAIVFLHHNSGSSAIWDGQWSDRRFAAYTLLRLDLPGHGGSSRSGRPAQDYTMPAMGHIMREAIHRAGVRHYIIAALSLGANVAGEMAQELPGCEGFFLTGGSVIGEGLTAEDVLLPFEYTYVLFVPDAGEEALEKCLRALLVSGDDRTLARLAADYRRADPAYRAAAAEAIAAGIWTDEMQHLAASGKLVSWIFGAQDPFVNPSYLQKAAAGHWKDQALILQNAGHLAHLDQPEAYNRLLLDFAVKALGHPTPVQEVPA